jgi:hypothetical protein
MGDSDQDESTGTVLEDVPDWDDEYVDRVSDRLMHSYDLERDRRVAGRRFTLYGRLEIERRKHFIHPAVTYGNHQTTEHLFVDRADELTVADLERLAAVGDELADSWIEAHEQHYGTDFVFGVVAPTISDEVRAFVADYENRTLLKYGYYGHYTVRLFVVAPEREDAVASPGVDVVTAFRLWDDLDAAAQSRGVLARLRAAVSRRS